MIGIEEVEEPAAVEAAPSLALKLARTGAIASRPAFTMVVGHNVPEVGVGVITNASST